MQDSHNTPFPDNVSGQFYVGDECISCFMCEDIAPESFRESDEGGYHIVFHQPINDVELELANEALEECPVEAIVNRAV